LLYSSGVSCDYSTAEAVQKCSAVVCFLTPVYENSPLCERELTYAANLGKPIIPCIVGRTNAFDNPTNDNDDEEDDGDDDWVPQGWLGILIADFHSADFNIFNFEDVDKDNINQKCEQLIKRIENILGNKPSK
jgi:hypothetical protein